MPLTPPQKGSSKPPAATASQRLRGLAATLWKAANDRWLNIETIEEPQGLHSAGRTTATLHRDNHAYASVDYWDLQRVIRRIAPGASDVVFEIGAGMGRAVCMFARRPIRKVVAIELNPILCERLQQNAHTLRGRRCPIEVRSVDAAQTSYDEGTVMFFVNPFGAGTLLEVLAKVRESIRANPRTAQLVYVNPLAEHREVFARQQDWLIDAGCLKTLHALDVFFFRVNGAGA